MVHASPNVHNTTQSFPWRLNDGELENLVKTWYSHVSSTSKTVKNHRIVHTHPLTGILRHTWEKGKGAMAHLQVTLHWASVCTTTCNSWGSKVAMCTSFFLLVRWVGQHWQPNALDYLVTANPELRPQIQENQCTDLPYSIVLDSSHSHVQHGLCLYNEKVWTKSPDW